MSGIAAFIAILVITLVNLALVGASSLMAVHGDGTPGGMYWVLGIGAAWVLAFTVAGLLRVADGQPSRGVRTAALPIPLAMAAVFLVNMVLFLFV